MKISKAFLLTVLLFLTESGFQLLSYFIFDTQNSGHVFGGTIVISRLAAYLLLFYFFGKPEGRKSVSKPPQLNLLVIFCIFLIIIGTEFMNRPFADMERIIGNTSADFSFNGFSTYEIYKYIAALLLAPILEELFFRKFLLTKLLQKNSFLSSLLISSLLFSILHWEAPLNLIPAFLMGLISGAVYVKTGRIFYSVLLHFLYNLSGFIVQMNAELYSKWLNWLDFGILYWTLFVFGIILTLFAVKQIPSGTSLISSENDHELFKTETTKQFDLWLDFHRSRICPGSG